MAVEKIDPALKHIKGMRPARLMVPVFASNDPREIKFSLDALNAGVYGLMLMDCAWLKDFPATPRIYESGVIYKPELQRRAKDGHLLEYGEDWQTVPWILYHGFGDCEDLASWRAAELRVKDGIMAKPDVAIRRLPSGYWRAHVRTMWPDGHIEDPSARLGMYAYGGADTGPKIDRIAGAVQAAVNQRLGRAA
jgi:hypothetical protein